MTEQKSRFLGTLNRIGYRVKARSQEIEDWPYKLYFLADTGRHTRLLSELFSCNTRDNFDNKLFETAFAYEFESKGLHLQYEVKQTRQKLTSIDFLWETKEGLKINFELGLVQKRDHILRKIETDLRQRGYCEVTLNAQDERKEIIRLQGEILSKVQDERGNPIKSFCTETGVRNVVVVQVGDLILGAIDKSGCHLTMNGDPGVPQYCRRGVFGMYEQVQPHYPPHIRDLGDSFSHFRKTIHGVLFVKKTSPHGDLDFQLYGYLVPNLNLLSDSDASEIESEISNALALWPD
jgi:hypothetical protein